MTVTAAAPPSGGSLHSADSWQHLAGDWTAGGIDGAGPPEHYEREWIFGFGSLIWHPGVPVAESVKPCFVEGYRRVFWQGSTDHRGTPAAPGRTVTLEPCEGAVTWGAAFRLAGDAAQRHRTWHYLEWREKEYDGRTEVEVVCPPAGDAGEPRRLRALTFIATSDKSRNRNYLGPAPVEQIAQQIASSRGPSGPNHEYLFRLTDAVRGMGVRDEELFLLEGKVRARLQLLELSGAAGAAAATAAEAAAGAATAAADGAGSDGGEQRPAAAETLQR
ncbi:cation transport regulator 2 [Micractinium conductrix]|uniref:glutathione-specific gamma-glutamylcyclotransferase n=1 Tax=Micractinium conductrix TaxID=554055 RepID=A0A2P6VSB9_9CHLO|nr:cation transport regulator 2 [Micractinium conductrix]|eukprot:PSC76984.1 cation transport regulator 2 [Micractinium conductrix]